MNFKIVSDFKPTGDQPEAIRQLVEGLNRGDRAQTLLGVTGSGKTFTIANVLAELNRPALILSHNKTLAAQLYGEFKQFFPENAVQYFVSYYDYYQPEAFIPATNTYIEKDLAINMEIDKMRLATTTALLSGRRDIIVVSSVSCLYGIGNPDDFGKNIIYLEQGAKKTRDEVSKALVNALYSRDEINFVQGRFRVKGETLTCFRPTPTMAIALCFGMMKSIRWRVLIRLRADALSRFRRLQFSRQTFSSLLRKKCRKPCVRFRMICLSRPNISAKSEKVWKQNVLKTA